MSHFTPSEFYCKCGRPECDALRDITTDHANRLEKLRERVGRPMVITSGLRCRFWNEHEKGEPDSEHLTGQGTDIAAGTSAERWQLVAANFAGALPVFERLGVGKSVVHFGSASLKPLQLCWTYYP